RADMPSLVASPASSWQKGTGCAGSGVVLRLLRASEALWQQFVFQAEADGGMPGIGQLGQARGHAKDKEHRGIDAQADGGVTLLDLGKRHAADERVLCHDRRRNSPAAERIADARAQLLEGAVYRYGQRGFEFRAHTAYNILHYPAWCKL